MSRSKGTKETSRLTLDLSLETRAILDKVRIDSNADSLSEAVRKAITVYALLVEANKNGETIFISGKQAIMI